MVKRGNDTDEYKEISVLNAEHGIYVVQHIHTGTIALKKILSVYDSGVYLQLYDHPVKGIPKIYALNEDNNTLTVIEEFIPGSTLQDLSLKEGKISETDLVVYMIGLCDILSSLHGQKPPIIHRDIKPSNIMLTDDGRIILIDLNAARSYKHGQSQDTRHLGTEGFAPPEQVGYGQTVPQTDIYAVGVTMNVLLTGELPAEKPSLGTLKPIITKCVKNDPENRYANAAVLKKQLVSAKRKLDQSNHHPHLTPKSVILFGIVAMTVLISLLLLCKRAGMNGSDTNNTLTDWEAMDTEHTDNVSVTGNKADKSAPDIGSAAGVYTGNDSEVLVLDEDGMAYYYCINNEFTELECPWRLENDRLSIDFARMHCTVYADIYDNDYSELIMRSDSRNWNTEVFKKIALEPDDYIGRKIEMYDNAASMNSDGTISYVNQGMKFIIPKNFMDFEDDYDQANDISFFVVVDADVHYTAGLAFLGYATGLTPETKENRIMDEFHKNASNFLSEVSVSDLKPRLVADMPAYTVNVSGRYNKGFGPLSGLKVNGRSALILNNSTRGCIYISILQTDSRFYDINTDFEYILDSATVN